MVLGPQGGWHVLASVRCTGIVAGDDYDPRDPTNPDVSLLLVDGDGPFGGYEHLPRPMQTPGGPALIGEFVILWTPTYAESVDRDAELVLDLTDATGIHITLRKPVHLVPEPDWEPVLPDTDDTADPADTAPDTGDTAR